MDSQLCARLQCPYCAKNVPNSHEPISFRNGNTLEGLSFFGFSCPLLSTRPLHRKVADKDYLNNGLGDLAGSLCSHLPTGVLPLVAALLWAPFKTRRVEIWYRYDEMRWNEMWYMCTYEMSDSEWLRVTPSDSKAMSATWKMTRPAAMASCAGFKIHLRAWVRSNASSWPRNGAMRYLGSIWFLLGVKLYVQLLNFVL